MIKNLERLKVEIKWLLMFQHYKETSSTTYLSYNGEGRWFCIFPRWAIHWASRLIEFMVLVKDFIGRRITLSIVQGTSPRWIISNEWHDKCLVRAWNDQETKYSNKKHLVDPILTNLLENIINVFWNLCWFVFFFFCCFIYSSIICQLYVGRLYLIAFRWRTHDMFFAEVFLNIPKAKISNKKNILHVQPCTTD